LDVMDLREAQRFGDDAGWDVRLKVRESRCYDQIETSLPCFMLTYREKQISNPNQRDGTNTSEVMIKYWGEERVAT
jgi:hypothetical protein